MSDVPEFAYRRGDAAVSVWLPAWASAPASEQRVDLVHPQDLEGKLSVRSRFLEQRLGAVSLAALALEGAAGGYEPDDVVTAEDEIAGRCAVWQECSGLFTWGNPERGERVAGRAVAVDLTQDAGRPCVGIVSSSFRPGSVSSARHLRGVIDSFSFADTVVKPRAALAEFRARYFGVRVLGAWRTKGSVAWGNENFGPLEETEFGPRLEAGHAVEFWISGPVACEPALPEPVAGYISVGGPRSAAPLPGIDAYPSWHVLEGAEVATAGVADDDRVTHRIARAKVPIGGGEAVCTTLRVEKKALPKMPDLWGELVAGIRRA